MGFLVEDNRNSLIDAAENFSSGYYRTKEQIPEKSREWEAAQSKVAKMVLQAQPARTPQLEGHV